ncbi:MAG: hypothetical protein J6V06_02130 [Clostridia bacterium]|nr:hypothetical protein [Clostridia bacterium]
MKEKKKNSMTAKDPYRFDLTGDYIKDGHCKISAEKSRIETEQRMKKESKQ